MNRLPLQHNARPPAGNPTETRYGYLTIPRQLDEFVGAAPPNLGKAGHLSQLVSSFSDSGIFIFRQQMLDAENR